MVRPMRSAELMDGCLANFTSFSTVFQSHQENARVVKKAMCNAALPTIERFPLRRGSNPGPLDQRTKATGVPLQNKPCKDGWVEEGGSHMHHNQKNKPYIHHQLKFVFQNANLLSQTREAP